MVSSLLSLGGSIKQITTMIFVSEQETPISSAINIAAFNTIFNSVNQHSSLRLGRDFPDTQPIIKPFPRIFLRESRHCDRIWHIHRWNLTKAVSEFQQKAFKKYPANKGKPYGGGLISLTTNINYRGYTIWRAGYVLVTGGLCHNLASLVSYLGF